MAIALNDLKALLETDSATIFTDGAETLLYWFVHQGQTFNILCEVMEEGEYVRFTIPYFLSLADVADRERALVAMLEINRRIKGLKFCYDPSDGEVSASIDILLEDSLLTERQVHRCMYVLTQIATQERDNLQTLLRTGVYPGSSDPAFTDAVSRLLEPAGGAEVETDETECSGRGDAREA